MERYSQADNGVGVIGLNRDPLLSSAEEIIADRGITYPNVRDEFGDFGGEIATAVDPRPVPSSFLVSDGVIVWSHIGNSSRTRNSWTRWQHGYRPGLLVSAGPTGNSSGELSW